MVRMRAVITFLLSFFLWIGSLQSQQRFTISGYVRDSLSRETLIGASLSVVGQSKGVNSNAYGFFALSLPEGEHTVVASFIGYEPREVRVAISGDLRLNIALVPKAALSKEIVVSARKRDANVREA